MKSLLIGIFGTLLPMTLIVAVLADILLVPAFVKLSIIRFEEKMKFPEQSI